MGSRVLVLAGTKKGAFILEGDRTRQHWDVKGPFCDGRQALHMTYDAATASIFAASGAGVGNGVYAGMADDGTMLLSRDVQTEVWKSTDLGQTWTHSGQGLTYGEGGPK